MLRLKQISIASIGSAFISLGIGFETKAAILSKFSYNGGCFSGVRACTEQVQLMLIISDEPLKFDRSHPIPVPHGVKLFEDMIFTASDVSKTFTATAETEPDFKQFAALLTNGVNNYVSFGKQYIRNSSVIGTFGTTDEKEWWYSEEIWSKNYTEQIDFAGNIIESITLHINSPDLIDVAVTIEGYPEFISGSTSVSEPASTLAMLAVATFSFSFLRKGKKQIY